MEHTLSLMNTGGQLTIAFFQIVSTQGPKIMSLSSASPPTRTHTGSNSDQSQSPPGSSALTAGTFTSPESSNSAITITRSSVENTTTVSGSGSVKLYCTSLLTLPQSSSPGGPQTTTGAMDTGTPSQSMHSTWVHMGSSSVGSVSAGIHSSPTAHNSESASVSGTSPNPSRDTPHHSTSGGTIAGAAVGGVIFLMLLTFATLWLRRRLERKHTQPETFRFSMSCA